MNNSNDTIRNRTRDDPSCSAVPQPIAPLIFSCLVRSTIQKAPHYVVFSTPLLPRASQTPSSLAPYSHITSACLRP